MASAFLDLLTGGTITRLVFFPTVAAIPLLFMTRLPSRAVKIYALVVSLLEVALIAAWAVASWDPAGVVVRDAVLPWISLPGLSIAYEVGIDGISLPLVLLTGLLLPLVILGSWRGVERQWSGFAASLLVLTTGILGALVALDLFLFYVFWEVMLIPMYFVIGIWGGERRVRAAVKFFLFTMAGSLVMLIAILWMGWAYSRLAGVWSFRFDELARLSFPLSEQVWLFAAFALAFAIKVPMFPVHTWLPRCSRSTPGFRTRTSRRRPGARSSWPASCSSSALTASCASPCRSSPPAPTSWRPGCSAWRWSASSTGRWSPGCSPT